MTRTSTVEVRRSGERFHTRIGWLDSRHSFSFGQHYDPDNTHFGVLMVSNDDVVAASSGHSGLVYPGLAQRMSAGTGILHSEKNAARSDSGARIDTAWRIDPTASKHDEDVHFVQMWVVPDTERITPGYEQLDIGPSLDSGELVVVASGMAKHAEDSAISIAQEHAALHAARLRPGAVTAIPTAPLVNLFVARGSVELEGAGVLGTGDTARITVGDGQRVVAGPDGAEVLVWEMHAALRSH